MDIGAILDIPDEFKNQPHRIRVRTYEIDVTNEEQEYKFSKEDFDTNNLFIFSMQLTADITEQAYNRGTLSLKLNEKEIYPSGEGALPAKIFIAGEQCPVNGRWTAVRRRLIQQKWESIYKDNAHPNVAFVPYKAYLNIMYFSNTD